MSLPTELAGSPAPIRCAASGYDFDVPLLDGDHVTDDAGTGFVHTAPGHGREDFDIWMASGRELAERGIDTHIPYTVDADGCFTKDAPGFEGKRVITDKGEKGDANDAVIKALAAAGNLVARGRLKHQYPHSLALEEAGHLPQHAAMVHRHGQGRVGADAAATARCASVALGAIKETRMGARRRREPHQRHDRQPARLGGLAPARLGRADHRLRREGDAAELLVDAKVNAAIAEAFEAEGADAWFTDADGARFLAPFGYDPAKYERVTDVLDVWFDSGSTHAFTLEKRPGPARPPARRRRQ